jgi:hypothetical protein
MNIEGFIRDVEMEIEELQKDLINVTSDVSLRIIEDAIQNRKDRIKEVKEKYLNIN